MLKAVANLFLKHCSWQLGGGLTTVVCTGIFRLSISNGNQFSTDDLATVGHMLLIPMNSLWNFNFDPGILKNDPLAHLCAQLLLYVHSPFWSILAYFGQNVLWFLCKDWSAPPGERLSPKLTLERKKQPQPKNTPQKFIQILPVGWLNLIAKCEEKWPYTAHRAVVCSVSSY